MKRRRYWILPVVLAITFGLYGTIQAQEEGDDDGAMAAMMQAAQPGEHHEHLQKLVGNWKTVGKFWMQPGTPATESDGTAEITSTLGGRFILTEFGGDFMGMAFAGMGMDGYDNNKKKHIGMWVDNMGTMMMTYEGGCSEGGKVTTMMTEFDDPMSGARMKMSGVTTLETDDKFTYEAYMETPDGTKFKAMEIVYTRQ